MNILHEQPTVTCLQLSYGRPQLSVEAVASFLYQTYPNKLLYIINTHHSPVVFAQDYPQIKVYNESGFSHLSDVYRFALSLVRTPYYFIWDDDDLFLPWHIADRVAYRLQQHQCTAVGHQDCFNSIGNEIKHMGGNMFVSQYLYDNNGVLPRAHIACWDVDFHNKGWQKQYLKLPQAIPSYIYRWGTGESHIGSEASEAGQQANYLNNIKHKARLNFEEPWLPHWQRNYVKDAYEFLTANQRTFDQQLLRFVQTFETLVAEEAEVDIVSAFYGPLDVTHIVCDLLRRKSYQFIADNDLFGDPINGVRKSFRCEYIKHGQTKIINGFENDLITLN